MKKIYVKRIIGFVLFWMLFLVMFLGASEIVRRKVNAGIDMVHSMYDLKKDSLDVVFVGSSHAYYGTQTNVLWDKYGITSYVAGVPSSTTFTNYYMLKEILKTQHPKVVAMETYSCAYKKLYMNEAVIRRVCDSLKFNRNKLDLLSIVCEGMSLKEKASYYIPFIKYHSRWDRLSDYDFYRTQAYLKGSKLSLITRQYDPDLLTTQKYTGVRPIEDMMIYLEKIIDLCKENDIQLMFYATPVNSYDKGKYKKYVKTNTYLEDYAKERDIPFLILENEVEFDPMKDFRDETHVNYFGQEKVSDKLGEFLSVNYGLSGHKGEAAYESWNKDYSLFDQKLQDLLKAAEDGSNIRAVDSAEQEEE